MISAQVLSISILADDGSDPLSCAPAPFTEKSVAANSAPVRSQQLWVPKMLDMTSISETALLFPGSES